MSSSSLPAKESLTDDQGTASTTRQPVVNSGYIDDESWLTARNPNRLSDEHRFSLFKEKFDKSYASQEEENFRLEVFRSNLIRAARDQELDPTAIHGVTQFSDLTEGEFREGYSGLQEEEEEIELPEGSKDLIQ